MCSMSDTPQIPGAIDAGVLSIALIGPDEERRKAVAGALAGSQRTLVREFSSYPANLDDLPQMLEPPADVVIVEVDSDPEFAHEIVESICNSGSATVMVYSERADLKIAVRFMRAGAREFLTLPIVPSDIAGALARVSNRRSANRSTKKPVRKLIVFLGSKGGCGVTTIAANFAVALAQESRQSTLLIDLGAPLGDAAINLGMVSEFSTANALKDPGRLDANFLTGLLVRHNSGLSVLAAPGDFNHAPATNDGIDKLIAVARQSFDYVVVDAGSRRDLMDSSLFDDAATVFLVTQVGVTELRNANRLITQVFADRGRKIRVVLNRYTPQSLLFDEEHITKALTKPAQWRIPDDYATARRTQNTATPIALEDSPISRTIRQMARIACGMPEHAEKKRGFSFFSMLRSSSKESRESADAEEA